MFKNVPSSRQLGLSRLDLRPVLSPGFIIYYLCDNGHISETPCFNSIIYEIEIIFPIP